MSRMDYVNWQEASDDLNSIEEARSHQPTTQHERDLVAKNKCPRCRDSLDTGWECTGCGYDAKPIADQLTI